MRLLLLPITVAALLSACTGFETNLQDTEVSYRETARQNYEAGDEAFKGERYNESIKFFEHVKNKYPYSKYAVLADLRVADAHFARERWIEAADAYRLFARFHPRHEKLGYALFRTALSHFNDIATDVVLFPPAHEMDQTAAKDAIRAFDSYLKRFPEGEFVDEANEKRIEARSGLAQHDLYAAEFYEKREKWRGAAWRYERVAAEFADTPLAPEALLKAGELYRVRLGENDAAKPLFQSLVDKFPDHPAANTARERLRDLEKLDKATEAEKKS
jgi:outer membrane protein assembly factor BamD